MNDLRGATKRIETLMSIGGSYSLLVGCTAGDSSIAITIQVQDKL
ncbi:hypothetical protein [Eoetvoesiella caeni]